jgi:DNA-binding NarL/FixJ family response regulator
VRAAVRHRPDVVLMDMRMPVLDGVAATRQVCERTASRVLALTMFDTDDYLYAALRAGASGFLLKDAPRAALVGAVRVIAAGDALLAPGVTARVIGELHRRGHPDPDLAAAIAGLTGRETDVLRLIAAGLSNAEIAAHHRLSEHTVKTHVGNLSPSWACATAPRRSWSRTNRAWSCPDTEDYPASRFAASMVAVVTCTIPATVPSASTAITAKTARRPMTCASRPPAAAPSGLVPQARSR